MNNSKNSNTINENTLMQYFLELKGKAMKLDEVVDYLNSKNATIDGVKKLLK